MVFLLACGSGGEKEMFNTKLFKIIVAFIIFFSVASNPKSTNAAQEKNPTNPAASVAAINGNREVSISRRQDKGPLKIFVLDVGQGDSIFIEFPYGETMLVDAGTWDGYGIPHIKKFLNDYFKVNTYKNKTIDVVVASHPDYDHIKGMKEVLGNYRVNWYIDNGMPVKSGLYQSLMKMVKKYDKKNRIDYIAIKEDSPEFNEQGFYRFNNIVHFKDVDVYVLGSYKGKGEQDVNNASIVMKIVYGKTSFLLTGDSEGENKLDKVEYLKVDTDELGENRIFKRLKDRNELGMLRSDVLKVGHHGSHHSATELYLSEVMPGISVISVGDYRISSHAVRFGHPRLETLQRLDKYTTGKAARQVMKAYQDTKNQKDFVTEKAIYLTSNEHKLKGKSVEKFGDIVIQLDGNKALKEN